MDRNQKINLVYISDISFEYNKLEYPHCPVCLSILSLDFAMYFDSCHIVRSHIDGITFKSVSIYIFEYQYDFYTLNFIPPCLVEKYRNL
jgi:hypothetical protein